MNNEKVSDLLSKYKVALFYKKPDFYAYLDNSLISGKGSTREEALLNLVSLIEKLESDFKIAGIPIDNLIDTSTNKGNGNVEYSFKLKALFLKLSFALLLFVFFVQVLAVKVVELPESIINKIMSQAPQAARGVIKSTAGKIARMNPEIAVELMDLSLDAALAVKEKIPEESQDSMKKKYNKIMQ
jgi:hypothetical protein